MNCWTLHLLPHVQKWKLKINHANWTQKSNIFLYAKVLHKVLPLALLSCCGWFVCPKTCFHFLEIWKFQKEYIKSLWNIWIILDLQNSFSVVTRFAPAAIFFPSAWANGMFCYSILEKIMLASPSSTQNKLTNQTWTNCACFHGKGAGQRKAFSS